MTHISLSQRFVRYVSFNVISMLGLSLYIFADTFFVAGGVGLNALAALNLAIPVFSVLTGLGMLLGMGGATRYSVCRAMGEGDKANRIFTHTLGLGLVVGSLLTALGVPLAGQIAALMGADGVLMPLATPYIRTICAFSLPFVLSNILVCFVRNDQAPSLAMTAMLVGSLSNIVLDYLFIFPLGGGMFGAAFATGLSPIITLGVLSQHFLRGQNGFRPVRCRFRPQILGQVAALGLPSFLGEFSTGFVMTLFNHTILGITGNMGVAAYGVVANISLIVISLFNGVAQGIQPLVSDSYGAGRLDLCRLVLGWALGLSLCVGAVLYGASFLFPDALIGIFNRERDALLQNIARQGVTLSFSAFLLMGANLVTVAYFAASGSPRPAFLLSFLRGMGAVVPFVLVLPRLWGMTGVWLVTPMAEGVTLALAIWLLLRQRRTL